jgi:hypothetical protein
MGRRLKVAKDGTTLEIVVVVVVVLVVELG